jgi:hypothetical protein
LPTTWSPTGNRCRPGQPSIGSPTPTGRPGALRRGHERHLDVASIVRAAAVGGGRAVHRRSPAGEDAHARRPAAAPGRGARALELGVIERTKVDTLTADQVLGLAVEAVDSFHSGR